MVRTSDPLISVVLPVYNAVAYLGDAVRSIQAQTYERWELIIVDDGSTDGSGALANRMATADRRVRTIETERGGAAQAVNAGAAVARGELLARMDADDVAVPERFAVQLDWMERTGVTVCGSCVIRFGDATGILWFPETQVAIEREMLFRHGLLQPTSLLGTEAFLQHRYRDGVTFEGNDLWIRMRHDGVLGNVPAVLLKHRCHNQQASAVRAVEMAEYVRATSRSLFGELYPDAGPADVDALGRIADRSPCVSIAELERAGEWLARLADHPDRQLRRRMLRRLRETCRRSAPLGSEAYRIYIRFGREIMGAPVSPEPSLRATCLARLQTTSRIASGARTARRRFRQARNAVT